MQILKKLEYAFNGRHREKSTTSKMKTKQALLMLNDYELKKKIKIVTTNYY